MYLVGPKHSVGLDALPYHMVPEATNDEESKEQGYGPQMANDGGAVTAAARSQNELAD